MFDVRLSNSVVKFLNRANPNLRKRVKAAYKILTENPVPASDYDLVKLSGSENKYRIRLSSYRLIYSVLWDEKVINILEIERRGETTYK
ncbi:MAG: type II toxin-antitoxin system RelE/ParE family toxin [Candidatus Micrarchaeota archaeon]